MISFRDHVALWAASMVIPLCLTDSLREASGWAWCSGATVAVFYVTGWLG